MSRRRVVEPTPEPAPPPAPEVFRVQLVALEEVAATLNRWHADGFVEDLDWLLLDAEHAPAPSFGTPSLVAVCYGRKPEEEPDEPDPEDGEGDAE